MDPKFDTKRTISVLYRYFYCIDHLLCMDFSLIGPITLILSERFDKMSIFVDKFTISNLIQNYRRSLLLWHKTCLRGKN